MATTESGIWYPGATVGHVERVAPSQGGRRYEEFVRLNVRQSKGRWRGKPLDFYAQQRAFHHELFRTEAGRRIHQEALYGVARKNGKSTDAAALALYLLTADGEPAPEVYGAAGARDQAKIILEEAKRMVRQSPKLDEWCKIYRNEIVVPSLDAVYRVVSADGGLQMGSNPSAVIADELHVWKGEAGRELYYALITGMEAREDPLFVAITTAGFNRDSICYEVYERGLRGELFMYWQGAEDGDRIDDPATWRKANPAPWLTDERLQRSFRRRPASVFARLHLNIWTESEQLWLPREAWAKCKGAARIERGERIWLGVDIGLRHDTSAVVMCALRKVRDGETKSGKPKYRRQYIIKAYIFDPAESGGTVELGPIEELIRRLARDYTVVECRYDEHFFHRSASDLSDEVRMVNVPAGNARMVPMSQLAYDAILDGEVVHDGDPALAKQVLAAAVRETERGWRVSKAKSQNRIDALVAMMLAMSGTSEASGVEPGARPIDTNARKPRSAAAAVRRVEGLTNRVRNAVYQGSVVECTTDDYHDVVRAALQNYAGECIDGGDHIRAQIALNEVQRLDAVHGAGVGLD